MKRQRSRLPIYVELVVICLAVAAVVWPLLGPGFIVSDDGNWMVIRLSAFYQSLRQGQLPVRYLSRLNYNYGYPVVNFLYPGFLYIGSLIHIFGFSYTGSVKLIMIGSLFGAAVTVYLWLRRHFKTLPSLLGSLSVVFAPYASYDMFKRGSVGEILAVFAASLLTFGLDAGYPPLIAFATAFLIVSHNSLALMFMVLFGCYIVAEKKWRVLPSVALGILMASFFWVPALYERMYIVFDTVSVSDPFQYFAVGSRMQLISIAKVLGLVFLAGYLVRRRRSHDRHLFFVYAFLIMLFFATPISAPLWSVGSFARLVQFPYRFLALELIAGAWILASLLEHARFKNLMFAFFLILLVGQWWLTRPRVETVDRPEGYYSTNEATTTVAGEYMPRWVKVRPTARADEKLEFVSGTGTITPVYPGTDKIYFEIYSETGGIIQINKIYYPGWGVTVDNVPTPIDFANDRGVMDIPISAGSHRIQADFRETPGRFLVDAASVLAVGVWLVLSVRTVYTDLKQS